MGKFDGVLICTDLDGTLLKNDKTVSEENKAAIEYFKREGGYFTFVTGRMPYYVGEAYRSANPNAPFGCINGGGVYDYAQKRYVWASSMPEGVMEIVEHIDKAFPNVGIQICTFDKTYFSKENEVTVWFRKVTGVPALSRHYNDVTEPIGKIIFCTAIEEEIRAVEAAIQSHPEAHRFGFVRSEKHLFEILPPGPGKGMAITKLTEYLKLDPNKTVAVGDYNNDISMFHAAKAGIAVANACPEALEAADYVTVSNEEHAIAQVIYDIEKGMYI